MEQEAKGLGYKDIGEGGVEYCKGLEKYLLSLGNRIVDRVVEDCTDHIFEEFGIAEGTSLDSLFSLALVFYS